MKKAIFFLLLSVAWMSSCKHEILNPGGLNPNPDSTGTGPNGTICFETDVLPLFATGCAKSNCHDVKTHEQGYVLDTYENIIKRGVVPGNAAGSKLYQVLFESGESKMPKDAPEFTTEQKQRIAQWINEGANNTTGCSTTCDATKFAFTNVRPILNNYCTSCHNTASASRYGNIDLSTYSGVVKDSARVRGSVQWLPGFRAMPDGSTKMPDCNVQTIIKWLNDGGKNN